MNKFFPTPREITDSGKYVKIASLAGCGFSVKAKGESDILESAIEYLTLSFNKKCAILPPFEGKFKITLDIKPRDARYIGKGPEAYAISITEKGASLVSATDKGSYYAAVTLINLLEQRGNGVYLPVCEIVDYPKFTKRGVLVESRYNDFMTLEDWKSAVDDFAALKLNKMEVAVYGCWSMQYDGKLTWQQYIPFKSAPDFNDPKTRKYYSPKKGGWVNIPETQPEMYSKDFFGEVIAYGKKKNVEVFPVFNSLGHNTLLPTIYPEISAKDENGAPTNSGLCTSEDKTYETIFTLYDEIIDRYLLPNGITSFSVGLDEVTDSAFCKCPLCRTREKQDIFIDHAIRLLKYLKARGMKEVYVYDDMFLYIFDNLDEKLAKRFKDAGVYDIMVMDWWNYGARDDFFRGLAHKINKCFEKSIIRPMSGYWHWQGWSDNTLNISECAKKAEELGFDGMISYSTYEPCLDYNYAFLSESCWADIPGVEEAPIAFAEKYFEKNYPDNTKDALDSWMHIRHRLHPYNYKEKPPANSEFAQYVYSYKKAGLDYPRNHIAEIMAKIDSDPARYVGYLTELNARATKAYEFFTSDKATPSHINENIITTVAEPMSYSAEALTLYRIYKDSPTGKLQNGEILELVKKLIRARKAQMLRIENSRLESIRHQTLRMMTLNLEYLWELLCKVEEAIAAGEQFVYDPEAALDRTAPVFKFLR